MFKRQSVNHPENKAKKTFINCNNQLCEFWHQFRLGRVWISLHWHFVQHIGPPSQPGAGENSICINWEANPGVVCAGVGQPATMEYDKTCNLAQNLKPVDLWMVGMKTEHYWYFICYIVTIAQTSPTQPRERTIQHFLAMFRFYAFISMLNISFLKILSAILHFVLLHHQDSNNGTTYHKFILKLSGRSNGFNERR